MRRMPLVIAAMTSAMALTSAPALANDGWSRDRNHLEPGCFMPDSYGHWGNVDLDTHLNFVKSDGEHSDGHGGITVSEELHVSVAKDAPFSVDQVLVKSVGDGYTIYNEFDTGTITTDPDIDPRQTGFDMFGNKRYIDERSTIVCVSDHADDSQNEPYGQEPGGYIHVKDSVILAPKVTAFGVSAIRGLKTYRIGFGYGVERWYKGYRAHQDAITIFPSADGSYNSRGVNDVDKAGESWASLFNVSNESDASDGQTFLFHKSGDMTAWADSSLRGYDLDHERRFLLTDLTQGDLPMKWTLRPTLAPSANKRSATFTLADFFAWNKAWQDYYKGGPLPTMALAPGTNSPDPDESVTVIVNPPLTQPLPTPANPTPAPVVVNPTPVTVTAPSSNANANAGANDSCKSNRIIKFSWSKGSTKTKIRYWNKTAKGAMSNGRMRASADFRGYAASHGDLLKVTQISRRNGRTIVRLRVFKAC